MLQSLYCQRKPNTAFARPENHAKPIYYKFHHQKAPLIQKLMMTKQFVFHMISGEAQQLFSHLLQQQMLRMYWERDEETKQACRTHPLQCIVVL